MELGLTGKGAIVCGASRGIGLAVATGLAQEGVNVVICARNQRNLEQAAKEIAQSARVQVLPVVADVSLPQDVSRLVGQAASLLGSIHILVNNAGGPPTGESLSFSEGQWQQALEQNFLSVVRICREVVPHIRRQGGGRIINILSFTVKEPIPGLGLSNAARLGVVGFAKTLAQEVGRYNITVNNVCPGYTLTDRLRSILEERARTNGRTLEQEIALTEAAIPLARLGRPEDMADLVVYLASDRASYITGATILADGGLTRSAY